MIEVNEDSLVYSPYLIEQIKPIEDKINDSDSDMVYAVPEKNKFFVFNKIRDTKLKYNEIQTTEFLKNKAWIKENIKDKDQLEYGDWFELFDNGVAIYKYLLDSSYLYNLQDECWKIEVYDEYLFLVYYHNWHQNNGFITDGFQIIDIQNEFFTIDNLIDNQPTTYYIDTLKNVNLSVENLIGKWESLNDSSKSYGKFIPKRRINSGRYSLYDDILFYQFDKRTLGINISGIEPIFCKWRINSDGTILLYEYKIENEKFDGYHVEYAHILKHTNDSLELKLFSSYIYSGIEKPEIVILNKEQIFTRIE